jgi:hypothetical protein
VKLCSLFDMAKWCAFGIRQILSDRTIWTALGLSFIGLGLCRVLDQFTSVGAEPFSKTTFGRCLVLVLGIVWSATLVVLLPLRIAWDRTERREVICRVEAGEIRPDRLPAGERALFWANYGKLPKWVYWPVLGVAVALAGITAVIIIGLAGFLIWSWSTS